MFNPLLAAAAGAWLISRYHSEGEIIHIHGNNTPLIPSPEELREMLDRIQHIEVREPLRMRNVTLSQQHHGIRKCARNTLVKNDRY